MKNNTRSKGFLLVELAVSGVILGILMMAFISMQNNQAKSSRRIAARAGVTDLSNMLSLMFAVKDCKTVGYFKHSGADAQVTVNPDLSFSTVMDTIGFSAENIVVSYPQGPQLAQMIHPYTIQGITFTPIAGVGFKDTGSGYEFPFKLKLALGSSTEVNPSMSEKGVFVYTDYDHHIKGICHRGSETTELPVPSTSPTPPSVAVAQSCPGNQVMTGIDTEGKIVCSPPSGGGSTTPPGLARFSFGGAYMVATFSSCGSQVNPMTGGLSCPPGFTAGFVGGVLCNASDPATRKLYVCFKN